MQVSLQASYQAKGIAIAVTIAAFAKTFVPFYLVGSTAIFAAFAAIGCALITVNWRQTFKAAGRVTDILVVLGLLYGAVVISFLVNSFQSVPVTYLLGIIIFHFMFLIFGFAAARAVVGVLWTLAAAGAVYLIVIAQHLVRFGDLMRDGFIHDVFGVGEPAIYLTFHQNIGFVLGLTTLAAFGVSSSRTMRVCAFGAFPFILLFMFHIASRGALVALVCSFLFLAVADLWARLRKYVLLGTAAAVIAVVIASSWFYQRALGDRDVDPNMGDAISRTIREIQDPRPGFRIQIWQRMAQRIVAEPDRLLFGRGVGMFPVNDGFGPPDWLLRKAEGSKHYPHNLYLEMLYETGIVGLLLFGIITMHPIGAALNRWDLLSSAERSAIALYVFDLVGSQFSGAFAYSYDLQFFFGVSVGLVAVKRSYETSASIPSHLAETESKFAPL
jgi:O-antigen ligase